MFHQPIHRIKDSGSGILISPQAAGHIWVALSSQLPCSVSPTAVKEVPLPTWLALPSCSGTGLWGPLGPREKADSTLPHAAPKGAPGPVP